jgi:hypothetical protein
MTYHQGFDRLGNQVAPPKPSWQHRALQTVCLVCMAGCVFFLLWVRP